ncbi:glycosyltransferase family 4 protein [Pedobacter frigiditerrae]|uniref:Glycosyltransferase family 4 protein n=1 Tax=Pedobacter frigiditerrae TaxID=2530452 RepID=A0A4R0N7D6_9SPHI|nr:glycosyltransferase family 4 protein [Pedobacter frigiditerrae]TCC94164.1 glycosyltransferase family 4 protein [Pedobacter frigiditerrae]
MSILITIILLIALFLIELAYFRIAMRFKIIDQPNARSSHSNVTLRGGGIIFSIAGVLFFTQSEFQFPYFVLGLFLISVISFLDDILTLNNKVRLTIHLISVLLIFYQWNLYVLPWYWLIAAGVFVIGTINAYNFMDGINGITGGYSLITIGSLFYINTNVVEFTSNDLIIIIGLSLLVFNFFNFRKKAKCFAGDVGSVSIAFILVFLIGQLIVTAQNMSYIFLLLIYGLDTGITVFFRLIRKENIFEAHRTHFYQFLANEKRISHPLVSFLYMIVQLGVNFALIFLLDSNFYYAFGLSFGILMLFVFLRFKLEGRQKLLGL